MKTEVQSIEGDNYLQNLNKRSDGLIEKFLIAYFLCGILLSFFYDTWLIGIAVGGASMLLYYITKMIFKTERVHIYVASLVVGIFMAQYIYQMHGLFEMHFFAFIGSALMITYQDWKTQLPVALFVVVHHAIFGYLQYSSFIADEPNTIYFTQLDYMDLQTFIIHGILATIVFFICALWAYEMRKHTLATIANTSEVAALNNTMIKNMEHAVMISNGVYNEEIKHDDDDALGEALNAIRKKLGGGK